MVIIQPYTRRDFFERIPDLANKRFIDLGCGSQRPYTQSYYYCLIQQLASNPDESAQLEHNNFNRRYGKNVIAVDIDYRSLLTFRTFGGSICVGDVKDLPLRTEIAHIVGMGWLLDLLGTPTETKKALEEIARVLKPKGHLIGDVALEPIRSKFDEGREAKLPGDLAGYILQAEEYARLIEQAGFEFLDSGLGFNSDQVDEYTTFYFIAQKNK